LVNRLPAPAVDELVRHFEAGRGIRATARATGRAPKTVGRYRRIWRSGRGALVVTLAPAAAARLAAEAAARGLAPSALAAALIESAIGEGLTAAVLG
jgi:hypothetical protein